MRCGFAYGTGQWRVEITDTEGMALADLDLLSDIHLALALNADAGDGPDGADAGAGEEEEEEAPARRHTAQTAAAAASSAADSGGQQTTRPRPSAPPLGAAGAATGDEEAGALSTRAALLSIGIEPQDLDRALAQLGEDADPGATLDAIESLSVAMALAAPPTLRRQRTGEDGRRPMPAVVDGMNVAVGAGRGLLFVGGALRRACDTLLQLGCTPVHVVLPQAQTDEAHRLIRGHEPRLLRFPLTNAEEVVALEREGFIIPAPPTARSRASYDDLLVIDVALQLDALVVSCDKYRCGSSGPARMGCLWLTVLSDPLLAGTCARDTRGSTSSSRRGGSRSRPRVVKYFRCRRIRRAGPGQPSATCCGRSPTPPGGPRRD